ncbi:MAG: helix-turn-helix domain-containing protein [Candidatus Eremiobacteraeota bacterium]|nr:helix-turn-helix domain-containing protein [Candidatus Eremiobacteraeota bacterium]
MEIKETEVYTMDEAAKLLKISKATIQRRIQSGSLHSLKTGRIRRIRGKDLIAFIENAVEMGTNKRSGY